jgi:hypothetical protein
MSRRGWLRAVAKRYVPDAASARDTVVFSKALLVSEPSQFSQGSRAAARHALSAADSTAHSMQTACSIAVASVSLLCSEMNS